jgi:hypothetical protein
MHTFLIIAGSVLGCIVIVAAVLLLMFLSSPDTYR